MLKPIECGTFSTKLYPLQDGEVAPFNNSESDRSKPTTGILASLIFPNSARAADPQVRLGRLRPPCAFLGLTSAAAGVPADHCSAA
jgi:hypothetical protein